MPRLLAFDFDGVISESAPECFVVALRTWVAMRPDSRHDERAALLEDPGAPAPEAVAADALYAPFLAMMPLGNRAEDYGVELLALEQERILADQSEYDAFKREVDPEWLRAFHRRFYAVRTAMSEADPAGWHRLMRPYPGIPEFLRRHAGRVAFAIATSKDRRSVRKLLEAWDMADLYPEGSILDKEAGADKRAHLEGLRRETGLAYGEMLFVDDKVTHLDDVSVLGVRCGLAAWGYNGERERIQARDAGHMVLELEHLDAQIFGADGV
jgi:phosphoglycolate phosphatase-like HAD superfamily hydrolase